MACILEPVGSVRPKIPSTDDVRGFRTLVGDSPALMCPAQGFPVPLYRQRPQHYERTRILRDDRSSRARKSPIINDMIRADWQCETQVPDDRRLQELSNDKGWLGHVAVPCSGIPCPLVQVSRIRRSRMYFSFFLFSSWAS